MISTTATTQQSDAGQQRSIVQQQVGRAAAAFAPMHEIQVAEDSVEGNGIVRPSHGVPNFCSVSGLIV